MERAKIERNELVAENNILNKTNGWMTLGKVGVLISVSLTFAKVTGVLAVGAAVINPIGLLIVAAASLCALAWAIGSRISNNRTAQKQKAVAELGLVAAENCARKILANNSAKQAPAPTQQDTKGSDAKFKSTVSPTVTAIPTTNVSSSSSAAAVPSSSTNSPNSKHSASLVITAPVPATSFSPAAIPAAPDPVAILPTEAAIPAAIPPAPPLPLTKTSPRPKTQEDFV